MLQSVYPTYGICVLILVSWRVVIIYSLAHLQELYITILHLYTKKPNCNVCHSSLSNGLIIKHNFWCFLFIKPFVFKKKNLFRWCFICYWKNCGLINIWRMAQVKKFKKYKCQKRVFLQVFWGLRANCDKLIVMIIVLFYENNIPKNTFIFFFISKTGYAA